MLIGIDQFLNNQLFSDCVISVNGAQFHAHRIILAAKSDYFGAYFTTELYAPPNVILTGITEPIMLILLSYMYGKSSKLTDETVIDTYIAADYLGIYDAMESCTDYLTEKLDPSNCINIYLFSKMYNATKLKETAKLHLLRNINKIIENFPAEFLDLGLEDLTEILESDYLNVKSEEKTWEAVLMWVHHEQEQRKNKMHSLLPTVRLGLLSPDYFLTRVRNHPLVAENQECLPIISATLQILFDFEVSSFHFLRRFRIPNEIVFALGGWTIGSPTNAIESYDTRADHWISVLETDPKGPRAYHGTVVLGDEIFVIGGYNGFEYFNSCRCFNIVDRSWRDIAPMHKNRCYVSVTFCEGFIYALGGYNGQRRQNTGERYDVALNQWSLISNMHSPRSDASATSLNGKVYIVGGFNGHSCLSSAEFYDPDTNQWEFVDSMSTRRSGVSCTAFENEIYVLGGFNGRNRLASGEKYNPETRGWTEIPDMIHNRSNFAVVVIEDYIMVIGGYDGNTTTSYVEIYCPRTRQWSALNSLSTARSALSACVASNFPNIENYSNQHVTDQSLTDNHSSVSAEI